MMQNIYVTDITNEKQTRATQVRHGEQLAALIEEATAALGVEKSVFLRSAIAKEAERVLEDQSRHVLTVEDAAVFAAALDTPPPPTPRALNARDQYRARVVYAD